MQAQAAMFIFCIMAVVFFLSVCFMLKSEKNAQNSQLTTAQSQCHTRLDKKLRQRWEDSAAVA